MRWDLHWEPAREELRQLPDVMYLRGGLGETTVLSPNPRVPLSGTVTIDGETLTFDRAVAGQTHLWGKKHAYSWTWGRCAEFGGAQSAAAGLPSGSSAGLVSAASDLLGQASALAG